jgi:hypothetical protein
MSGKLIKIWNASQNIVKIGPNKIVVKPGESAYFSRHEIDKSLLDAGKIIEFPSEQEQEAPKKKKKEIVEVVEESTTDAPKEEEVAPITEVETTEDSILPEESI